VTDDEVAECTCDLIDASEWQGPKFIRGWSNGCKVHPPSAYEVETMRRQREFEEQWDAKVKAAEKAAREAP
jgi:hypothetical protein